MKKNITVNIFGVLYQIDEDAYELLQKYNENMRRYYSRREDGEEIADDVEHRVAELLSEYRSKGVMAIPIEHVKEIFRPYGTEFYYVELIAPQEVRLQRNATENRISSKRSKADIAQSSARLMNEDQNYRLVSHEGEIPFDNYLRIDNTNLSASDAAKLIKETFDL